MATGSKQKADRFYDHEKEIQWHLNAGSNKIHAKRIPGVFRRLKWGSTLLWLFFFIGPYLRWDGTQALLFDIPNRQFHLFSLTVHPQDIWVLSFVLFFLATLLITSTVIAGRAFCGYLCFQTVWTDIFSWIEAVLEGTPRDRYKLDSASWTPRKFVTKTTKHLLWLLIAAITGLSFAAWFTDVYQLWADYFTLQAHVSAWIVLALFVVCTYVFAGFMREQVCLGLCPYSRIQAVMYDNNTLLPTYDEFRGEPRTKLRKSNQTFSGACVDCDQCLAVCPTGIDIREGSQIGCITCGLCIDACDSVMQKINRPTGLVRYVSHNQLNGLTEAPLFKRPQVVIALLLLFLSMTGVGYGLTTMSEAELSVVDVRQPMYVLMADGKVQNRFEVRVFNKTDEIQKYRIDIAGLMVMEIKGTEMPAIVEPGKMARIDVLVKTEPSQIKQSLMPLIFSIHNTAGTQHPAIEYRSVFKGPEP